MPKLVQGRYDELGRREPSRAVDRVDRDGPRDHLPCAAVLRERGGAAGAIELDIDVRIRPEGELSSAARRGRPRRGQRTRGRTAGALPCRLRMGGAESSLFP